MDDLVLNIATDVHVVPKHSSGNKGGRWTDRVKAKRVEKRKAKSTEKNKTSEPFDSRPTKKPRIESSAPKPTPVQPPRPNRPLTQVISSLFSYNPKIETPVNAPATKAASRPSNAPLIESSGFSALGLDPLITAHLASKMSIDKPTSIQRAVLPAVLSTASEEATARDVFIQSQTGSGKTLSFLLPIIQDLLPLSSHSYIDRSIGTLAIIIAPTRELAKQISDVLEALLQLRLRPEDESADDPGGSSRLTRWLVSGLLTGGATRAHEKARIRKGVPIVVSTPGRLLDHLQNTSSFNVSKCRWLVLDEADRLMELGFEETITGIIQGLDGRRKIALQAMEEGKSMEVGGWDWDRRRRTVLCSATIREDVQKLAGKALINPMMIKATAAEPVAEPKPTSTNDVVNAVSTEKFTPPSQLAQKYVVVPLKLRLVALIALLRSLIAQSQGRRGTKIIVFLSCTDSVDFHFNLLEGSRMGGEDESATAADEDSEADSEAEDEKSQPASDKVEVKSSLLPDTSIFRLHGSLPTPTRLASLRGFSCSAAKGKGSTSTSTSAVLLCTSVASRGLDLPLVRAVIQYDLPTEGGATEYVHRVGRTARAGKGGEAWSMVSPSESEWVKWVEGKMRGDESAGDEDRNITLTGVSNDTVLRNGFGGKGSEFEARATEVQLAFERWVLRKKENAAIARKAFLSHMRAYATHPSAEKHIFHVRNLHLGHLAKSFALRDAPKAVSTAGGSGKTTHKEKERERKPKKTAPHDDVSATKKRARDWEVDHSGEAEKRMQAVVRSQGRLTKKGGMMRSSGASEFQIASGAALERGGGIGGLCLAVALSKYAHIQVDVYEGAGRFKEIGAGVMIWNRTWRILELLGLAEQFEKVLDITPSPEVGFEYRRSDRLEGFKWHFVSMPYGCIRFHRAHFLDVFVDNLPQGIAHFGKRLVSYEKQAGGDINLMFADGTNAVCDVLVGCDGIKSVVRAQMLRTKAAEEGQTASRMPEPRWTGSIAYRGLIPSANLPSADGVRHRALVNPMMYCGQNKHVVAYSISQGNIVNVVAFATESDKENQDYGGEWVTECSKDEMLQCFAGWEPEVMALLERIDSPTKWGIHHLEPKIPFYVSDRVVLVGDAAHGMSPHLGSGAGQAIEDALVLASVLGATPINSVDKALEAYQRTRLPVANGVLQASFESGKMFEFNSAFAEEYGPLGPAIGRQWDFLTESTPEGEVAKAVGILRSLEQE
ncbi:RNA helicase [Favolaschia claudopus]|uniref:ATP-dependent RNA helicase n=1 Tax=Favolaschia claudopus TaxID=2862362 RepID=A0AAW0A9A5_9AGAR